MRRLRACWNKCREKLRDINTNKGMDYPGAVIVSPFCQYIPKVCDKSKFESVEHLYSLAMRTFSCKRASYSCYYTIDHYFYLPLPDSSLDWLPDLYR